MESVLVLLNYSAYFVSTEESKHFWHTWIGFWYSDGWEMINKLKSYLYKYLTKIQVFVFVLCICVFEYFKYIIK